MRILVVGLPDGHGFSGVHHGDELDHRPDYRRTRPWLAGERIMSLGRRITPAELGFPTVKELPDLGLRFSSSWGDTIDRTFFIRRLPRGPAKRGWPWRAGRRARGSSGACGGCARS